MGRPLTSMSMQTLGNFAAAVSMFMIVLTAVFSVFTAVIFLCGTHTERLKTQKTVRLGGENEKRMIERMKSSLSSGKTLLMANIISWRKVREGEEVTDEEENGEEDGVIWKKTIIRGDKCRPLEFSGKILYDSDGNLLPDCVK